MSSRASYSSKPVLNQLVLMYFLEAFLFLVVLRYVLCFDSWPNVPFIQELQRLFQINGCAHLPNTSSPRASMSYQAPSLGLPPQLKIPSVFLVLQRPFSVRNVLQLLIQSGCEGFETALGILAKPDVTQSKCIIIFQSLFK